MSNEPALGVSQRARQARTIPTAHRHGQPWTEAEDRDLATCTTDEDLEAFALRWGRRFASVEQRRRRPRKGLSSRLRPGSVTTSPGVGVAVGVGSGVGVGTGWIQ